MPRTIINLLDADKAWLDAESKRRGQSMTSLVSEAVAEYRVRQQRNLSLGLEQCLAETSGLWQRGDGRIWQEGLRREWATIDDTGADEAVRPFPTAVPHRFRHHH